MPQESFSYSPLVETIALVSCQASHCCNRRSFVNKAAKRHTLWLFYVGSVSPLVELLTCCKATVIKLKTVVMPIAFGLGTDNIAHAYIPPVKFKIITHSYLGFYMGQTRTF